jgi:hypothetical protein
MFQTTLRPKAAVVGMIAVGIATALSSFSIVRAEHVKPRSSQSFVCSSGTACVEGDSTSDKTWGIYGLSSSDGVHGLTTSTAGASGVAGESNATSGNAKGVYGSSTSGDGVYGRSTNANGVYGASTKGAGVYGTSSGEFGIEGTTGTVGADAIYGYFGGTAGNAVVAESRAGYGQPALVALGDGTSTGLFLAFDEANFDECTIDSGANLTCSGTITGAAAVRVRHHAGSGQHVLTYASESATATIEDVGTARMFGGVANVAIPGDFASLMDRNSTYYVFLTPLGDTRGLYVSLKTPSAFQVRETEHGRSSLAFDYRIVAHPIDAKNDRLPIAPAMRRPSIMRPAQQAKAE